MRVSLLSFRSGTSCDQWDSRVTAAEYLQQVCVAVTFTPFQTSVVVDSCGGYTRQLSDVYILRLIGRDAESIDHTQIVDLCLPLSASAQQAFSCFQFTIAFSTLTILA